MTQVPEFFTAKSVTNIIGQIRPIFKGLPHLPQGLINFIVTVAPWLAGLGGILGIFSGLGLVSSGLGVGAAWWMQLAGLSPMYFVVTGILQIIASIVLLLAFNPLKSRQKVGWILLFWNMGLSLVQNLVAVVFTYSLVGSVAGTVIGLAIGLYILFEIEKEYA